MIRSQLEVINARGLHARAAAKLAGTANQFSSDIRIGYPERMVDSKNIMQIMMLAAAKDTVLEAEIRGQDAQQALTAITELFARRFDEEE